MKLRTLLFSAVIALLSCSCVQEISLQDTTADPNYQADKVSTYYLWKVIEIDDVNVNGIDITDEFDWFKTFSLQIRRKDGKIAGIKMNNGDIPHNSYGFDLPTEEVACYFDSSVQPNVIRRTSDNAVVAVFRKGVICMEFSLDCNSISYRYMFSGLNENN